MARLTIDTEEMDISQRDHLVKVLETERKLAVQKRDDYQVLAVIGSLEEIEGAVKILRREGVK